MIAALSRGRARARRFARTIRRTRREAGTVRTVELAARLLLGLATQPWTRLRELLLDRRLGVDTRGEIPLPPDVEASAAHPDSVFYQATPAAAFGRVVRSLPIASPQGYMFVDLGCGKGRMLVLAAMHGFDRVVGVELDARLIGVARSNIEAFRRQRPGPVVPIELIHEDAAHYRLPAGPTVLYLHNPFGAETMADVVHNIRRSPHAGSGSLIVAYFNPLHRQAFDDEPLFRPVPTGDARWVVYVTGGRPPA